MHVQPPTVSTQRQTDTFASDRGTRGSWDAESDELLVVGLGRNLGVPFASLSSLALECDTMTDDLLKCESVETFGRKEGPSLETMKRLPMATNIENMPIEVQVNATNKEIEGTNRSPGHTLSHSHTLTSQSIGSDMIMPSLATLADSFATSSDDPFSTTGLSLPSLSSLALNFNTSDADVDTRDSHNEQLLFGQSDVNSCDVLSGPWCVDASRETGVTAGCVDGHSSVPSLFHLAENLSLSPDREFTHTQRDELEHSGSASRIHFIPKPISSFRVGVSSPVDLFDERRNADSVWHNTFGCSMDSGFVSLASLASNFEVSPDNPLVRSDTQTSLPTVNTNGTILDSVAATVDIGDTIRCNTTIHGQLISPGGQPRSSCGDVDMTKASPTSLSSLASSFECLPDRPSDSSQHLPAPPSHPRPSLSQLCDELEGNRINDTHNEPDSTSKMPRPVGAIISSSDDSESVHYALERSPHSQLCASTNDDRVTKQSHSTSVFESRNVCHPDPLTSIKMPDEHKHDTNVSHQRHHHVSSRAKPSLFAKILCTAVTSTSDVVTKVETMSTSFVSSVHTVDIRPFDFSSPSPDDVVLAKQQTVLQRSTTKTSRRN